MSDFVKLATEIVLLLTAVVGLYKGSQIVVKGTSSEDGAFSSFLGIAAVLGSILLFPLFIVAFIGIIRLASAGVADRDSTARKVYSIDSLSSSRSVQDSSRMLLEAAARMLGPNDHDDTLEGSVNWALRKSLFPLAVAEADAIIGPNAHDRVLEAITDTLLRHSQYSLAIKAAGAIVGPTSRDEKLRFVIRSAERYGFR
jgi:hypothetical protein